MTVEENPLQAASEERAKKEEKNMTIQEFKSKAENSADLKLALKEAVEKGEEALMAFLKAQGVEIPNLSPSRVELSEDDLDAVVGGLNIKKKLKDAVDLLKPSDVEKQVYKDFFDDTKKFVEKVVHDTIYV